MNSSSSSSSYESGRSAEHASPETSAAFSTATGPGDTSMRKPEHGGSKYEDAARNMGSALLASGISIASMRRLLDRLGLGEHAAGALEKRELAYTVALACSQDHLLSLRVSELKRRAQRMDVNIATCFDKRSIVEVLHEAVVAVVEHDLHW